MPAPSLTPPAPIPAQADEPELPPLHLPVTCASLRLELPEPVAVAAGAPSGRHLSVAGFVAAELRSIPTQWIEEATGRRGGGAAAAVAAAPALPVHTPRPVASARVHLVALPELEAEPDTAERLHDWPLAPAAIIRPCPLPDTELLFGPLRSSYVDGPSLLRELGGRAHSGALITAGGGRAQAAILHRGSVLALLSAGRSGTRRLEGLRLPLAGQREEHDLTVPRYAPEVAVALSRLVNLTARFRRMHASFVRLPQLLEHLAEGRMTGGVRVTTGADAGVLLFSEGEMLGGYTARHPALDGPELVARLCAAEDAEIDVHAAPLADSDLPALEVARLLG
ncbi:MAG TPA: DUF4388 domain-containing protein [Candidatus Dormibacteraeota bacterium]|nr:DUF4388 domain-containing protein [Candidatus Dormibacteraeota bacterium]